MTRNRLIGIIGCGIATLAVCVTAWWTAVHP
jgi:hypothetical protein